MSDKVGTDVLAQVANDLGDLTLNSLSAWVAQVGQHADVATAKAYAGHAVITLARPIAATEAMKVFGVSRGYGVSTDVHQITWSVHAYVRDVADPYGPRIATDLPVIGAWEVSLRLTGRPAGPLPGVAAGASPAYDLAATPANVGSIMVRLTTPS